jgi:hypothetical protein
MLDRAGSVFSSNPLHSRSYLGAVTLAACLTCVLLSVGCGSKNEPKDACSKYAPPADFDASQASVTFSADVYPIFERSCAFDSCHGGQPAEADLFLGKDAARVYMNLVGVASKALPSMSRVETGDPDKSLLMHKLDGDACALSGCTGQCSETMPAASDQLAESERLTIRSWIAQGARND